MDINDQAGVGKIPDLAPREGAALEWWFFQGRIEGETLGQRDFMLSLFRHRGRGNAGDGHMLLASTLDPASGRQRIDSQVCPQMIDDLLRATPEEATALGFDGHVVDAFVQEVANGGPPAPTLCLDDKVETSTAPFALRWNGTRIGIGDTAGNGAIELSFTLPGEAVNCTLTARPQASWLTGQKLEDNAATMDYDCCPRLALEGMAGGEAVSGRGWFDHQWGEYGWLRGEKAGDGLMGWVWLGINLDDGRDAILGLRKEMKSGRKVSSFCAFFEPGEAPRIVRGLELKETRRWQSPRSLAEYPIGWEISVPDLELELTFSPTVEAQEIPVLHLMGTIWQGAGSVSGTRRGKPVAGPARLELQGFAYVPDYRAYMERWGARVDRHIAGFLPRALTEEKLSQWAGTPRWAYDAAAQQKMVSRPAWDLMERGGKHWRPIFGLLLLDALGADRLRYEGLMSVLPELIHNGSVIIDDIEDNSRTRRGEATIHRRYGLATALNAGNMLYFLPLLEISAHEGLDTAQRGEILELLAQMFARAHLGQAQDLYWSSLEAKERARVSGEEKTGALVLQAHAFKSAAAVKAIAEIACVIARAPAETRALAARLGESWGTAFQMVDDVNNFAAASDWGKVRGEDIHEGKVTYPVHLAMRALEGGPRRRLTEILGHDELRQSEAGLEEAIGLIEASGALERCRAEARALMEADWPAFSAALPQTHAKLMLRALLTSLLDLRFEM